MNFPIDFEPDLSSEDEKTIYEGLLADPDIIKFSSSSPMAK